MSQGKWRETKQQPSGDRSNHHIQCCLVSLHFLCDILSGRPVQCRINLLIRNMYNYVGMIKLEKYEEPATSIPKLALSRRACCHVSCLRIRPSVVEGQFWGSSARGLIGRCKTFVLPSAEHDDGAPLSVRRGRGGVFRRSHCKICTASSFIRTSRPLERRIHWTCYFGIWCCYCRKLPICKTVQ